MEFSVSNIFQLISAISPFMLGFFLIMCSVFNQDAKAFIYLGGIMIASVINVLAMALIRSPISSEAGAACNLIDFPIINTSMYNSPAFNSMFIAFTSIYLIVPMFQPEKSMGNVRPNWAVIGSLTVLFFIDSLSKLVNNCTNISGIAFGALLGSVMGFMWFSIIRGAGANKLLYFNSFVSNKQMCSRPSKQQFICKTYRNGELVSTNIA